MDYVKEFNKLLDQNIFGETDLKQNEFGKLSTGPKDITVNMANARKYLYDNRNNMTSDQFDECLYDYGDFAYREC